MNLILIRPEEVLPHDRVVLRDNRAKHVVKILQGSVGDELKVGILNGFLGKGIILSIVKKYPFSLELKITCDTNPPKKNPVDLILALPRPIMLKRIISQATSLGVGHIHVIHSRRVEKSFWKSGLLEKDGLDEHVISGLEQAIDTVLPHIEFHRKFKPFVEDYLPTIQGDYQQLLFAHPGQEKFISDLKEQSSGKTLIAIGPEGGWIDFEVNKFNKAGFSGVSIGERILRVDTAVISIHGRLMSLYRHQDNM